MAGKLSKGLRMNWVAAALCALAAAGPASAAETVKIGFIEVLSGPFALAGEG